MRAANGPRLQKDPRMATTAQQLVLERGRVRVELSLQPFAITIRAGGRRMVRGGGAWVVEGTVKDQFVQFTEGVIAHEERAPLERARRAVLIAGSQDARHAEL